MKRLWFIGGLLLIAAIVFFSLTPHPLESNIPEGDKLHHLLGYGVLMAWWSQLKLQQADRLRLAIGFIALGIVMEVAQGFTPTRQPDVFDALANTTGILLGWLASPPRIPNFYARLAAAFPRTGG
jgi:VanZ family protein